MTGSKVKSLLSIAKAMEEQMALFDEYVDSTIKDIYGLDLSIKDVIKKLSIEDIDNLTEEDLYDNLSIGFDGEGSNPNIKAIEDGCVDNEEYPDFESYAKHVFKEIKDILIKEEELGVEKDKLAKEIGEYTDKWFEYIDSSEYREKNIARIKELREKAENETDPEVKRKTLKLIRSFEDAESLNFLFTRFDNMKEKEVANIKDIFFNNKRNSIVVNKFNSKMKAYGYGANFYKLFFDLEEKFLPDKYKIFNNLFLFVAMRYIGYSDAGNRSDKLNVAVLIRRLYNLIYHKFDTNDREKEFISVIERIDDYFMEYADVFEESNITHYNHPVRIESNKEYEKIQREEIIKILEEEGFEDDFDKYSLPELKNVAAEYIKEKKDALEQKESKSEEKESTEASEKEEESSRSEGEISHNETKNSEGIKRSNQSGERSESEDDGTSELGRDGGSGTDSSETESGKGTGTRIGTESGTGGGDGEPSFGGSTSDRGEVGGESGDFKLEDDIEIITLDDKEPSDESDESDNETKAPNNHIIVDSPTDILEMDDELIIETIDDDAENLPEEPIEYDEDGNLICNIPETGYIFDFGDTPSPIQKEEVIETGPISKKVPLKNNQELMDPIIHKTKESPKKSNEAIEFSVNVNNNLEKINIGSENEPVMNDDLSSLTVFNLDEEEEDDSGEGSAIEGRDGEGDNEAVGSSDESSLRTEKWDPDKAKTKLQESNPGFNKDTEEEIKPAIRDAARMANHFSIPENPRNVLNEKNSTDEDTSDIEILVDIKGNYYIEDSEKTYAYCDHENNVLQENIDELVISRLYSSGNLKKSKLTL